MTERPVVLVAGGGLAGITAACQLAHAETLFTQILAQDGTRLPSDRRYEARLRTPTEGISIPNSLHETLLQLENPQGQ